MDFSTYSGDLGGVPFGPVVVSSFSSSSSSPSVTSSSLVVVDSSTIVSGGRNTKSSCATAAVVAADRPLRLATVVEVPVDRLRREGGEDSDPPSDEVEYAPVDFLPRLGLGGGDAAGGEEIPCFFALSVAA